MERTVQTPDGRILAVQEVGDPAGKAVLVHMGTPNSRHIYGPNAADAAAKGLRRSLRPSRLRRLDSAAGARTR